MCSKRYKKVKDSLSDFDNSWEEEIERLKHDIKRTERKIFNTEQNKVIEGAKLAKRCDRSDSDSIKSLNLMDLYSSPVIERIISGRRIPSDSRNSSTEPTRKHSTSIPTEGISKETCRANWVSPSASNMRLIKVDSFPDVFSNRLESSFEIDCGSSVISLDFGLISPKKNWCSPPQRIERAQNREWSSPHRVIDRPNPENSPGNWISMKESCLTLRHSPTLVIKSHPAESACFACPEPEPRPVSQATYVIPETVRSEKSHSEDPQPTRKTSVLVDYEPERIVSTKKRGGGPPDAIESNLLPTNDKVRRVVDPSGHVIKISLLNDFEAPVFGKSHDKTTEAIEKEIKEPSDKGSRGATSKITKISTKLSPTAFRPLAKKKKEEPKEEGGTGIKSFTDIRSNEDKIEKTKKTENSEEKPEDVNQSTQKIIQDLEEILRSPRKEDDKPVGSPVEGQTKQTKPKLRKFKPSAKIQEKPVEAPEKRKRNVDPKAVQEYIKSQKQKRLEQVKTEKKTKDAEKEARKKKLEELRIKTLKLASQSKKKKLPQPTIKVVEPGTEDDVTMSLGLKQTKPKVSYNESVSKLKKKSLQQKQQPVASESQPPETPSEKSEDEDDEDKTSEIMQPEKKLQEAEGSMNLKKPEETVQLKSTNDLNETLKRLADTLHLQLEKKEEQLRSKPVSSKSVKNLSQVPSQETLRSVKSAPEENRQVVTVDLETIQTLKSDIKKISENFKVLHEIIVDKADLSGKRSSRTQPTKFQSKPELPCQEESKKVPEWLKTSLPRAYPYNVFTAFQQKMNLKTTKSVSSVSQESSTFAEPISNKYDSEFETLSVPSDRLRSLKEISSIKSSCGTSEENFSIKDDSASEMSSSILDSEKQSLTSEGTDRRLFPNPLPRSNSVRSSSINTEITSKSIQYATSKSSLESSFRKINEDDNLILVTPDLKLISNDLHHEKLNNCIKNLNLDKGIEPDEEKVSEKSIKELKSGSTITELIDDISENSVKSVKSTNEKPQNVVQTVEIRRSFFQPEMLHLQFQAELTLLETFQQSLTHFLEAERMKTVSEVNKIVSEKRISTEKLVQKEDQAIQTSYIKESLDKTTSEESDSVRTEINVEEESIKTEQSVKKETEVINETSEKLSISSRETVKDENETQTKELDTSDFSNGHSGISFQMLNRMMKDEELRSEHQLALIRLREKTLNEKVKAELTFLEMKKRALKERSSDEEHNISAIKKRQRGILLKYQSEKEEIERLKKMHKIASEERKIMIKQQKQLQQMQISTNDMIIKLKKKEKLPQKKTPLKPKALRSSDSEIPEDIPVVSESVLTESCSGEESRYSSRTDLDFSSRSNVSEDESEILRRNTKTLHSKLSHSLESFKSKKSLLELEKYPRKRHSVEELLSWTKRLEEKENHLKELEKQTMNAASKARNRLMKSLKSVKSMKDRSTSPFHFQDSAKTISKVSLSEVTDTKNTTVILEEVESNSTAEVIEKIESEKAEKVQSSASEDIPEQLTKKISSSRTTEYYSESFESPSSSETPKNKPEINRIKSVESERSHKGIAIKLSLSPRMQSPRRRYSSGSDDSLNFSHTETASEQSDLESRIAALHEQLRKRKLEAERLRREQKKAQKERLKVKEQSLLKQIQAYDAYIQKKKQELQQQYEPANKTVMKPLIKQPKVAEKSSLKRQEPMIINDSDRVEWHVKPLSKRKEEVTYLEKLPDKESDSEVTEHIKDASESVKEIVEESDSIREQLESKLEEEEALKMEDAEISSKESYEVVKSTSVSESLEQNVEEESQSESEDQSLSVKTTLLSPEKPDTEVLESSPGTSKEESSNKQTIDEDAYQFESFESDAEEKITVESEKTQKSFESETEIKTESAISADEVNEIVESVENDDLFLQKEPESDKNLEKAEKITDSIITGLILESLEMFCKKKTETERKLFEESKLSLEALSSFLAKEIIQEAVDDMIGIYNKKLDATSERIATEMRRRISEIMSQANGMKEQKEPGDMTDDVSPVASPLEESVSEDLEREKFVLSVTPSKKEEKPEEQSTAENEGSNPELKTENFNQEWIDDDYGLSQTRREAEELRLQQLQIEQEIQQLQAQQEQVPYFYLREIPNKPPPPYTPPGKPLAEVPTSESDIMTITLNAVRILTDEMSKGKQIAEVEPPWDYYGDAVSEHFKCYKFFLFDLTKHIISCLIEQQEKKTQVLPWMRTREHLSKYKYQKIERTFKCLSDFVQKQVLILFGFDRKVSKESLIVKWIKKKRDHVDEILVRESQEEEAQWTQYDEDQVTVKNEVTLAILDNLLEDTAQVLCAIFSNKMKKEKIKKT